MPSRAKALLGLTGLRGDLVPVYSLAQLLGYARAEEPAWLLLCGAGHRFGLAFGQNHGCFSVEPGAFGGRPDGAAGREVVAIQGLVHTVVALDEIARAVTSEEES
ncbi:MAG: hypothetical protein KIS92_23430 [Planctomycetota bacterium]|nr:hypothetical protein [Planctomycetota bacterium]